MKWQKIEDEEVDYGNGGKLDEPIVTANVDINNDGIEEKIVRIRWSIGGALNDAIYVLAPNQKIVIPELVHSERRVQFNADNYWLNRNIAKYGKSNFDWLLV